jgi:hypothetical protein
LDARILLAAAETSFKNGAKPICLDYYEPSAKGEVSLVLRTDGTKVLAQSKEEYTSEVVKNLALSNASKVEHLITVTQNSIYITLKSVKMIRAKEGEYMDDDYDDGGA